MSKKDEVTFEATDRDEILMHLTIEQAEWLLEASRGARIFPLIQSEREALAEAINQTARLTSLSEEIAMNREEEGTARRAPN